MALNENKLQGLQDNINKLEVQKGMHNAVVSIQKDIFDVFTESKVRVSDKKSVVQLKKGLEQSIARGEEAIAGKSNTDKVNNISVKTAKEHITRLSAQKDILTDIYNSIQQINDPKTITPNILKIGDVHAKISKENIVTDNNDVHVALSESGSVVKKDGDRHRINFVDTGAGWQIEHDDSIIGKIQKDKDGTWETKVFSDKIEGLGITELHIPLIASKTINLSKIDKVTPSGSSTVEKRKTWKINTEQLTNTSPVESEDEPAVEPPVEDNPPVDDTPASAITINAHLMDKESLVKKSIEQDVLEEYQHKYAKRRWPQRLAMYTYARFMQNRRIEKRLGTAKSHNDAIETDVKRQQRIASSIGNFAGEYDLGLDAGKVKKTAMTENAEVNTIASNYIKGIDHGGISRQEAIEQFNNFFSNNSDYQTGMTGTDIMEQLDDIKFMVSIQDDVKPFKDRTNKDREVIQEKIRKFYAAHPTAKLHGVHFNNPHIASNAEIDKLCDHALAYRSKMAVGNLNNVTAKVKLYKVEKDTVDLTQSKLREKNRTRVDTVLGGVNALTFGAAGSTRGRAGLKTLAGVGLASTGVGSLGVVGGVAITAAALQWMKTYRDYLTEAQKTHEDAMTMGTKELDRRIKELEDQIKKHNTAQKVLAFWGFGKHAIRTKQLNILHAVNDKMHKTGAMKPALQLIQELQHSNRDKQGVAIGETLARLKAGRELETNFISGTNRGLTEQERKDLLVQLREAGVVWAQKMGYGHLIDERTQDEAKWRDFWEYLRKIPNSSIGATYDRQYTALKKNFEGMKDDINKGRKKMAWRDARTNLTTSATVAGVAAGVSAISSGMGWTSGTSGTTASGPHNEYDLGKYETATIDKAPGRETAFNNGDKVSFHGEAAVDAVHASTNTFGSLSTEISDVRTLAGAFDATTQATVNNALTVELAKVKAEAIAAGADTGNVMLTQQRWVDGIEDILTKLQAAGKTGVTIQDIKFDPSTFNPIDIQASAAAGSGVSMQDIVDRSVAFEATIDGVPGARSRGDPLRVVWPGFSNTYAKPGEKSKHDDSWSKRAEDLAKQDKEKEKQDKKDKERDDEYNRDFERRYGAPQPYVPTPPVEDKKKYWEDKWQDNENKPFEEPTDGPQDHPYGDKDDKRGVSPRGREGSRRESDVPRYFEKDYPLTPELLDPRSAAEKIIAAKATGRPLNDMPFIADRGYEMSRYTPGIEQAIQERNWNRAVDLLTQAIRSEQDFVREESQRLGYDKLIKKSLNTVDSVFDELGVSHADRAEVPDVDHIHIIPSYLFYAQYGRYSKDTLGFVYNMNGHIFVNNEALVHGPQGDRTDEEKQQVLLHIINHEIIHGATTSNYHKRREEINGKTTAGTEEYAFLRRLGAQMTRRINKNGSVYLQERGRALNEGLTESLNLYLLQNKLGMHTTASVNAYEAERKIVDTVGQLFDIKKQDLYKFLINRKFGKEVIKKVYGEQIKRTDAAGNSYNSYERPGYITLLMDLMDIEHLQRADKSLPLADNFVNKKSLVITKQQSKGFHPSLIKKDGSLKDEILQAYPFITQS